MQRVHVMNACLCLLERGFPPRVSGYKDEESGASLQGSCGLHRSRHVTRKIPFPGIKAQLKRWFKRAIATMKSLLHLHSKG